MNILLTGASGFLGQFFYRELSKIEYVETLGRHNSTYLADLSKEIPSISGSYKLVIHAAGKAHQVPKSKVEEEEFYKVNVNGTVKLLNALESLQPPKSFVFISSVAVYALNNGVNINENTPLSAKDPYGLSKIQAEFLVQKWCSYHNVICTILRLPLLVGANPPGNLGAMINGIARGYYFNIAGGNVQKSMVLASDVAKCILKVSEIGGIYNLTDGSHPTFNELSRTISLQMGRKFVPNMPLFFAKIFAKIGDLIGDKFPIDSNKLSKIISPLTFDDTKARKAFGWNPSPVIGGLKFEDNA